MSTTDNSIVLHGASLGAQQQRIYLPMQLMWAQSLCWEDSLGRKTATHFSILVPGKPHGQRSLAVHSMESQRIRHNSAIKQQQQIVPYRSNCI